MPMTRHFDNLRRTPNTIPALHWFSGIALGLVLASCAPPAADQPADQPPPSGGAIVINMTDDNTFAPASVTISVGDSVTWVNVGQVPHTSTDTPGAPAVPEHAILPAGAVAWDSGLMNNADRKTVVFTVPGEYAYFCGLHEAMGMVGTITVTK